MNTLEVIFDKIRRNKAMISARCLASVVGQIISMQGAMGPVVRLRTRNLYDCLIIALFLLILSKITSKVFINFVILLSVTYITPCAMFHSKPNQVTL
jgi:hypothetical protein